MKLIIEKMSFGRELIQAVAESPLYGVVESGLDSAISMDEWIKIFDERKIKFEAFHDVINLWCELSDLMALKSFPYLKTFEISQSKVYALDIFLGSQHE